MTGHAEHPLPEPFLVADHTALDFLNSVAAPWGAEIEWLATGQGLLDWLQQARLLPPDAMAIAQAASDGELDELAAEARDLRDWLRKFVVTYAGSPLGADALRDLASLNDRLHSDRVAPRLTLGASGSIEIRYEREWTCAADLLKPLVACIADLVTTADFGRIRNCEGPTCTLWFLDTTRNNKRRWCTMSVCGNRAKASAFRARKRGTPNTPDEKGA